MRAYILSTLLLLLVAFSFATTLEPWHQSWEGGRTQTDNLLEVALGDSRELLARHFFAKADSYFHNGFAPTIFDKTEGTPQGAHMAGNAAPEEGEHNFLGQPRDWIDGFSRNFYPSRHTHLGEGKCDKCEHHDGDDEHAEHHAHDQDKSAADEREMLPWLQLSLQLDPKRVETYVVAAYWLKNSLKSVDGAERLLREGLQNVPGNPEILFELGRVQLDDRHDVERARNIWELALKKWNERERDLKNPNLFILSQILGNLAILEENAGRPNEAIQHLRRLQTFSPNKASIAKWIETLQPSEQQPN
jgi:tetratricopeptide (TPR) repeat protein